MNKVSYVMSLLDTVNCAIIVVWFLLAFSIVLNSVVLFSDSYIMCLPRLKNPVYPALLPITGGDRVMFFL